ncbi:MAG: hypothetical protein ACC700_18450 [Anaerolineales bacterium]
MSDSDVEALQGEINGWLDPGEQLLSWTTGTLGANPFGIVVALTSKYLRLGSTDGGRNIALDDIREIRWSSLWARLNVRVASTNEKMVFAVSGRDMKYRARELASAWRESSKD